MKISVTNTICLTTSRTPLRCKLEADNVVIQEEMKFRYLGIEISGYGYVEAEVRKQAFKETRTYACLNSTIWRNKHMGTEVRSRIYSCDQTHINIHCRNQA